MLSTLRGSIVALIFALIVVTAASTGCSGLFEDLDDLQFSGSQNQTPNQASAELSSITGESGLPADGESVATITIELFDSLGDPIAGVTPSFTASGEGNDLLDCGSTDETGVATCGLVSVQPGAKELSITHPVSVSGDPIVFLPTCDPESAEFGGGEGHADDPWRICSVEQLELISDHLSRHFVLLADLDLSEIENFQPIGDEANPFNGGFDGSFEGLGFTISHLTIDADSDEGFGLFGVIGAGTTVRNVTLQDAHIQGFRRTGALAGTNYGAVRDSCAHGTVDGRRSVGGLVGRNEGAITDSCSSGGVTGSQRSIGGLAGTNAGEIHRSHSSATVSFNDQTGQSIGWTSFNRIGGLVGDNNEGEVTNSFATGRVSGYESVGGLVGQNTYDASISRSYSAGEVTGNDLVGGLVGHSYGQLHDTYSTSQVEGGLRVGGLVGGEHAPSRQPRVRQ